jgi:hypothetical protein
VLHLAREKIDAAEPVLIAALQVEPLDVAPCARVAAAM